MALTQIDTNVTVYAVVTSIQAPTAAILQLSEKISSNNGKLIVIGDRKGPEFYEVNNCDFYSLQVQKRQPFLLSKLLPEGHYSRKNLGYLVAMQSGAPCIYETDDDNAPLDSWRIRSKQVSAYTARQSDWVNIYRAFSNELIWPRGFPLDEIASSMNAALIISDNETSIDAPVQQGLSAGSPDVDAIWRLILGKEISFVEGRCFYLPPDSWCPFNSQSTWWWPESYPLLYLPSHCSFRMTDIWRSFIAQKCLWAMGHGVVFHSHEVYQERNEHSLLGDFMNEVPGYEVNGEMVRTLSALELDASEKAVGANMLHCYRTLVSEGYFPEGEIELVEAWRHDLALAMGRV